MRLQLTSALPSAIFSVLFGSFLARSIPGARATALTTYLAANERSCFYADVDGIGEKVGFYFSVQSGGSFDIDYMVQDPEEKVILEGQGERQGDFIFTANTIGEYSFCFENEASLTSKLIDFDIMVESEPRRMLSGQTQPITEHTSALEESMYKLQGMLANIGRTQKYFHTRHHRNHSTVKSTESRIFWYSILECLAILGLTFSQVWILKTFFSRTGRRLNGALKRSESANMQDFRDADDSGRQASSPPGPSQPLDAFLCFDVEATCVADKQIDWPNEIIEFPVILLEWVTNEEPEQVGDVSRKAEICDSASKTSPSIETSRVNSKSTPAVDGATEMGTAESETKGAETRENNGNSNGDAAGSSVDDAADETLSEGEVEDLLLEDEIRQAKWRGKRRLVIKDTFHSYVRPVWQPTLTTFCTSLTGISQDTIDKSPTFPEMVQKLEQWLDKHSLLVDGKLRDGACWCTDGPWDLRDFLPKQLHITPLKPNPYPAYLRGPVLNTKAAVNYVLTDLWYVGELEKAAALEARYRATLEDTRRKTEECGQQSGSSSPGISKCTSARPPPPESPVQKKLRNLPRLCSTGSWALSLKGTKMPRFFLTISGQLKALGLGEFQGQQHSGIDDTMNIARVVIELARRDVLLDVNEKPFQAQRCDWMGRPGQVFWNRKILLE